MLPREAETFVNNQHSHHTTAAYTFDLKKWFTFLGERTPSREIALEFRKNLEERLSPRSAARAFNTCRAYYRWLNIDNPFESIKSPKRLVNASPKVPTDADVDALVKACDNTHDMALVALLLNGLRISEASGLTPADWNKPEAYETYVMRVVGKGFKQRFVPATDETASAVERLLATHAAGAPYILGRDGGRERLTNRQIQYTIEKLSARAGVARMHPHMLRHHYATRLLRADVSLEVIKELLGHESIATTSIYITLDLADIVAASRKDPRNGNQEVHAQAGGRSANQ